MFQLTFENDYPIADSNHRFLHLWKTPTPGPCSPRIPVLWAEEEQEEEDEKTTKKIEEEKRKDKKRDQHDDSLNHPNRKGTLGHPKT